MLSKQKKVRMFLDVNGKCEYCGRDMVLSFANKCNVENLATFDHLYNRDHEKRHTPTNGEKRVFIVCKKCNNERNKTEPNKQQANGVDKMLKIYVPEERWTDEKFLERIRVVMNDETELSRGISSFDRQIQHLKHEKNVLENKLSKKVKYRNILLSHLNENKLNSEPNLEECDTTDDDQGTVR